MIRTVKLAYFSPSGGTYKAACLLCEALGLPVETVDCTCPPGRLPPSIPVPADQLLVAAFPVYGGLPPRVEGLFRTFRGSGGPCVLLAAYGNRAFENALAAGAAQLQGQGFVCVGGIACITPHVFAPKLGAGRPDAADAAAVSAFAQKVLCACAQTPLAPAALPGQADPPRKPLTPLARVRDKLRCDDCGRCVQACPTGALDLFLEVDGSKCINCLVCRFRCPTYAWQFDVSAPRAWLMENFTEPRPVEWFA